jgi:hypothetical protein
MLTGDCDAGMMISVILHLEMASPIRTPLSGPALILLHRELTACRLLIPSRSFRNIPE